MELTAVDILNAYQLGLISVEEARSKLGFTPKSIITEEGK